MQPKVRILLKGLALIAGVALLTAPAFAQVAFSVSSLPQQARFEGLTETMGAVQATNNGAAGVVKAGSSVTVVYSATITNLTTSGVSGNQAVLTCSAGVTGGGGVCAGAATVTVGNAAGGQITISFTADTTFGVGSYMLVSQVRVNVNALGSGTSTVTATLSGTSSFPTSNPLTFTNATVPVAAIVNPSLSTAFSANGVLPQTLQTCAILVGGFTVGVTERYPAAFTTVAQEGSATPSGFTPSFPAVNGTSAVVTITGLPSGISVLAGAPVVGSNGVLPLGATTSTNPQTSSGSALTFSFPTNAGSTSTIDSANIPFSVGILNSAGTGVTTGSIAALGTTVTVSAAVSIGPIQAASSGPVSMATNTEGSGNVLTVGDCVTNLLFPFATNQVGFDTAIKIANTSSDKLAFSSGGATAQNGTCTLSFWPTDLTTQTGTATGNLGTPSQITTPSIPAGGVYEFMLSGTSFKLQSGYMIGVCRFLDAYGYSYVLNGSQASATISEGLPALVIPSTTLTAGRLGNVAFTGAGGTYESLNP